MDGLISIKLELAKKVLMKGIIELETEIDSKIKDLEILKTFVNAPIVAILNVIDGVYSGGRNTKLKDGSPNTATDLSGRMSYLEVLLVNSKNEMGGANCADVLGHIGVLDSTGEELTLLIAYLQLCEVVPQVRKSHLIEKSNQDGIIRLQYPNSNFERFERLDIIFSELASPLVSKPVPKLNEVHLRSIVDASLQGKCDVQSIVVYMKEKFDHFLNHTIEDYYVSNETLKRVLGFEVSDFQRVKAAVLSFCTIGMELIKCYELEYKDTGNKKCFDEMLEWICCNFNVNYFYANILVVSGVKQNAFENIMKWFEFNLKKVGSSKQAGEGFLPPIFKFDNHLLFNPFMLCSMFSIRNIFYSFNKFNPKKFSSELANNLEPYLLDEAKKLLKKLDGLEFRESVHFKGGEIDLVLFSRKENVLLQVQIKATIAPQSARMVNALEERVKEGLSQLSKFQRIPQEERDKILSKEFGYEINNPKIVDCILLRSCVGTAEIWEKMGGCVTLNLFILKMLVKKYSSGGFALETIDSEVKKLIEEIESRVKYNWDYGELKILDKTIQFPFLDRNKGSIKDLIEEYL